jgi:autotransporter-associated beta strand protein
MNAHWARVVVVGVVVLLSGRPAAGQSYTWTGFDSGNWNDANNWSMGGPPTSSASTALTFGGTINPTMINNLLSPGEAFNLNSMTFNSGSSPYTLSGNPLNFQIGSGGTLPTINQNNSSSVTINTNIILTNVNGLNVLGTGTGTVLLNGAITGTGTLVVNLPSGGTVVLGSGSNTYALSGFYGTAVTAGTLRLGNGNAIPTGGSVYVAANGTFDTGGKFNSAATAVGTLNLAGGTFQIPAVGADYWVNNLQMTGGTVSIGSGNNGYWLHFTGTGAAITTNATNTTATWTGSTNSQIRNDTANPLVISVARGSTASGIDLDAGLILGGTTFTKDGFGTMRLTNTGNTANLILQNGYLRVDDMAALGSGTITVRNGILVYQGATASSPKSLTLDGTGGATPTISVPSAGTNLTLSGTIQEAAAGTPLFVFGQGTLTLANAANPFSGAPFVFGGATLATPTIGPVGTPSPIGTASAIDLGNAGGGRGTLLLTGTAANYSTDRTISIFFMSGNGGVGAVGVQNAGTILTLNGQITGYTFVKTGVGTVVLAGTSNNYTGGTVVEQGKLLLGPSGAGQGDFVPAGTTVTVNAGAELNTNGNANGNPIGVNVNGGTFRLTHGSSDYYYLTRLDMTGGLVDASGTTNYRLYIQGPNGGIGTTPSSQTAVVSGPAGSSLFNFTSAPIPINVAAGTTSSGIDLDLGFTLNSDGFSNPAYLKTGSGTLRLTVGTTAQTSLTVLQGRLRVDDVTSNGGNGAFGPGAIIFDGGTFQWTGTASATTVSKPFTVNGGGMGYEVTNPGTVVTQSGTLTGAGGVTKTGPGSLSLTGPGNTFLGGVTVLGGTLLIPAETTLGSGPLAAGPAGTILYTAAANTNRTFNLTGGTLRVADGATVSFSGATVNGGFLRSSGTGNYVVGSGGVTLNGVTVFNGTPINQTGGPVSASNLTFGGTHTIAGGQTFTLNGGNYTASSQLTVNGTANVTDFTTVGKVSVVGTGQLVNTGTSPLVFGGGSVTNVGLYNPTTGQVTSGGTINLGAQDMVVQGGFVRNNGHITSTTGNLVIDAGGLVRGSGTYDVNSIRQLNGGQFFSGNSPGLVTVRNLDLSGGAVVGADLSNATGLGGSANPAGFSGWGVTEYGATNLTSGRLTITATASTPAVVKFNTVTDTPPRNTYAAPTNFDRTHAYTWVVFRPGTTAGFAQSGSTVSAANQDDFTTQNTIAQIAITDATTGTVYSHANGNLSAAVLNQYLKFDPTAGSPAGALGFVDPASGSAILASVGTFGFVLGPDTLGNPDRVISLVYTPVPEPAAGLVVAAAGLAGLCLVRRPSRSVNPRGGVDSTTASGDCFQANGPAAESWDGTGMEN